MMPKSAPGIKWTPVSVKPKMYPTEVMSSHKESELMLLWAYAPDAPEMSHAVLGRAVCYHEDNIKFVSTSKGFQYTHYAIIRKPKGK